MYDNHRSIETTGELAEILDLSEEKPVLVLKHSTRCPVSSMAFREYKDYAPHAASRGVECVVLLVVESRAVSMEAAEILGVGHQSPQAILLRNREAVWNIAHGGITRASLEAAEQRGL